MSGYKITITKRGKSYFVTAYGVYAGRVMQTNRHGLALKYAKQTGKRLGLYVHDFTDEAIGKRNPNYDNAVIY